MNLIDRLDKKIRVTPTCWFWTGSTATNGYGNVYMTGKMRLAHRAIYELLVEPIPVGLVLDHLCRNRSCVNPDHLEPVTRSENAKRSPEAGRFYRERTECLRGHPFDEQNTYRTKDGKRHCRACHAVRERERKKCA